MVVKVRVADNTRDAARQRALQRRTQKKNETDLGNPLESDIQRYLDEDDQFTFKPPAGWKPDELDLADVLGKDYVVILLGRRGTGKSFCTRYIVYCMRDKIPRWYVFTKTKLNRFYQDECCIPSEAIFDGFPVSMLHALVEEQRARVQKWKDGGEHETEEDDLWIGIILDDVGTEMDSLHYNKDLQDIVYHGRHLHIFLVVTEQYFKFVGPGFRKNTDVPILFRADAETELDDIRKSYLGFMKPNDARRIMAAATEPEPLKGPDGKPMYDEHGLRTVPYALCRDTRKNARVKHPAETLFTTFAKDPEPFICCCEEQWGECRESPVAAYERCVRRYNERHPEAPFSKPLAEEELFPDSESNASSEGSESESDSEEEKQLVKKTKRQLSLQKKHKK